MTAASNSWENFKYICRYFNRFFDISEEKRWREHILEKMDGIWRSLEKTLGTDGSWYRARTYEFDRIITQYELDCIDAYEAVGPAPYDYAKNNRMSPAGISYIYLSSSRETCAREIRALDGQHILVGRFRLKKALVLLDMTIENVESLSFDPGSIFSEEYDSDMIWIKGFLLQFAREISRPISEKDAELEYVPTQLLAEYIRKQGYAGIIFSSSLCPSERNVVLFYGPTKAPPCNFWNVVGSNVLQKYSDALTLDELSYEKVALIPSFSQCATRTSISEPAEDKSGTEFACPKG